MTMQPRRQRYPVDYTQYRLVDESEIRNADTGAVRRYITKAHVEVLMSENGRLTSDVIEDNSVNEPGIAGVDLSNLDLVYRSSVDGKWYPQDTDSDLIQLSDRRGIVNNRVPIGKNGIGLICIGGYVYGFSGLTPGALIYATTTPGGYSDTKPVLMLNGPQQAIAPIGYASEDGKKINVAPKPIVYQKRVALPNGASTTITHHADTYAPTRRPDAYAAVDTTVLAATYALSNRDSGLPLRGPVYTGGVTTVATSGTATAGIGSLTVLVSLVTQRLAQGFRTPGGKLKQITVQHGAIVGNPQGPLTWAIHTNVVNSPSTTVLQSGSYTPPEGGGAAIITIENGIVLEPNTDYWLVLSPSQPMIGANAWQVLYATNNPYSNGNLKSDTALVGTLLFNNNWSNVGSALTDLRCTITVDAIPVNDMTAQPFRVGSAARLTSVGLLLAKVGAPTGTLTFVIRANTNGVPGAILATANPVSATTLDAGYSNVTFAFAAPVSLDANTTYFIDLTTSDAQSATNYVMVGVDQSASDPTYGFAQRQTGGSWVTIAPNSEIVFEAYSTGTQLSRWVTSGLTITSGNASGLNPDTMTTFLNTSGVAQNDLVVSTTFG